MLLIAWHRSHFINGNISTSMIFASLSWNLCMFSIWMYFFVTFADKESTKEFPFNDEEDFITMKCFGNLHSRLEIYVDLLKNNFSRKLPRFFFVKANSDQEQYFHLSPR